MDLLVYNKFIKIDIDYDIINRDWIWFIIFYEFEIIIIDKYDRDLWDLEIIILWFERFEYDYLWSIFFIDHLKSLIDKLLYLETYISWFSSIGIWSFIRDNKWLRNDDKVSRIGSYDIAEESIV